MAGKTILVTGSTDGIGKATALMLLTQGHQVIIHGRNKEKGADVAEELTRETRNQPSGYFNADLSSQTAVRRLAREVTATYPNLDVLINNAGTYQPERHVTEDGVELTFAVNYVAPFLLTRLLRESLEESAPARVVNVASTAHRDVSRVKWENLQGERGYDPWYAYSLSKFAMIIFTYRLAEILRGSGVTANCLHPGVVNTKILHTAFPGMRGILPREGAKTSAYLATSPELEGVTGTYYEEMRPVRSEPLTYDQSVQDRLWKVAEKLTGVTYS